MRVTKNCVILSTGRECTKCMAFKKWDEFYKNPRGVNGRDCACVICRRKTNGKPVKKQEPVPMATAMTGMFKSFLVERTHLK